MWIFKGFGHSKDYERYNRQQVLLMMYKIWIEGVLDRNIDFGRLIIPDLKYISNSKEIFDAPQSKDEGFLAPGTRVIDVFDEIGGNLLISGNPGAGKTTILLDLARELISRARIDEIHPIPVVLSLSSWRNKSSSLDDWLIKELRTRYNISRRLTKQWIAHDQLLLLLDGLDEVKEQYRLACTRAISGFQSSHMINIVLCSREHMHLGLSSQLGMNAIVVLQPFTMEQVDSYLASIGDEVDAVRVLLQKDLNLRRLAQSPVMLSMIISALRGVSVEEINDRTLNSMEKRHRYLFDVYVQHVFGYKKNDSRYTKEKSIQWLSFLANTIREHHQTIFRIESIRPEWLPKLTQHHLYVLVSGLADGLDFGVALGLPIGLIFSQAGEVVGGLAGGIAGGLAGGLTSAIAAQRGKIDLGERLFLFRNGALAGLIAGVVLGLMLNIIAYAVGTVLGTQPSKGMHNVLLEGTVIGLVIGLALALANGVIGRQADMEDPRPGAGVHRSIRNAVLMAILFGLTSGSIGALVFGVYNGIAIGLSSGLSGAMIFGGMAYLQHVLLRFLLYRGGNAPWRYREFLDFAVDQLLLRRVDGGYIFTHRLLLEHFSNLDKNSVD